LIAKIYVPASQDSAQIK